MSVAPNRRSNTVEVDVVSFVSSRRASHNMGCPWEIYMDSSSSGKSGFSDGEKEEEGIKHRGWGGARGGWRSSSVITWGDGMRVVA